MLELLGPDSSNLTVDILPLKRWISCLVGLRGVLLGLVPFVDYLSGTWPHSMERWVIGRSCHFTEFSHSDDS